MVKVLVNAKKTSDSNIAQLAVVMLEMTLFNLSKKKRSHKIEKHNSPNYMIFFFYIN